MGLYRVAEFDDLIHQADVEYFPPSHPPEPDIDIGGTVLCDTPDDFLVLPNAIWCTRNGLIWRDFWLGAAVSYLPDNWREAEWMNGDVNADGTAIEFEPEPVIETVSEPVLLIDMMVGGANFGHSIHDTMPYGLLFKRAQAVIPGLKPLVAPFKFEKQRELFSMVFGYPYEDSRLRGRKTICFKKLVIARRQTVMNDPYRRSDHRWHLPFAGLRHVRTAARAALGVPDSMQLLPASPPLNVLLHRFPDFKVRDSDGFVDGRNYLNYEDMFKELMKQGFLIFEPGWMNLAQIIGVVAKADLIVGVHGAQYAYAVFCLPGTKIFEIRSHYGNWRSLQAMCAVLGHEFTALVQPRPEDRNEPRMDIPAIVSAVKVAKFGLAGRDLVQSDLQSSTWQFSRQDGSVIAPSITLLSDGTLGGYSHPNEWGWKIAGGRLALTNIYGSATADFDDVIYDGASLVTMKGRHTFASDVALVLRRLDLPTEDAPATNSAQ